MKTLLLADGCALLPRGLEFAGHGHPEAEVCAASDMVLSSLWHSNLLTEARIHHSLLQPWESVKECDPLKDISVISH